MVPPQSWRRTSATFRTTSKTTSRLRSPPPSSSSRKATSWKAPWSVSTRMGRWWTSATSPRVSSPPRSCRSARTSIRTPWCRSVSGSRRSSSTRRTTRAGSSCRRSVPSTSVRGAASSGSPIRVRPSGERSSRSSRADSSWTSVCVASCRRRSSICAGCVISIRSSVRRSRPRSSNSTETATTSSCHAAPISKRSRRSSVKRSSTISPRGRFARVSCRRSSTSGPSWISEAWTGSCTSRSCPGST